MMTERSAALKRWPGKNSKLPRDIFIPVYNWKAKLISATRPIQKTKGFPNKT